MYKEYHLDITKPVDPQMVAIFDDFGSVGVSPGYAGAYLEMTRQAIDAACRKGALRAMRIYENGKLHSTLIDTASLDAYKELKLLSGNGRIPYRARAIA